MTSSGPYTQSYNMTHMWDITDLRGCLPKKGVCARSLTGILKNHPDFTKFNYVLELSGLDGIYNDKQANFTLFVPSDKALRYLPNGVLTNMDKATARHLIKSSTLDRIITSDLLESSQAFYVLTKDLPNRLFISNVNNKTYINGDACIVSKDLMASNGIIHVIDVLLWPEII